ncbi:MAG: hypothetical protein ACRDZV_05570 [Acidimicrobiia bacterium]
MPQPYRRRTGLIYRRANIGNAPITPVLDGGRDAPLSRRGPAAFWLAVGLISLAALALIVWARLG